MSNQKITTSDTFEAAFYLGHRSYNIRRRAYRRKQKENLYISALPEKTSLKAQQEYFNSKAYVNIWDFRRCLTRINSLVGSVKANEKKKASKQEARNDYNHNMST